MISAKDIFDFLDTLAPPELAMDWDNSGLQIGSRQAEVQRVLVALDPFADVAREAAAVGSQLVVTHHPLFFHAAKAITDENDVGRTASILIQNNIGLYSCHTNLDIAPGGVNDVLASVLGLTDVTAFGADGLLRKGTMESCQLQAFLAVVKEKLDCPGLRYVDAGKPCRQIAVGGGACADEMEQAAAIGCDTFVTSDVKYNQFWDAKDLGLNLIDAGHFYTENPVCRILAQKMQAAFPALDVRISQNHADCMKFF